MDNSQYYKFTMTPTTAATGKQITITNTKDVNNFVYPSLYSLANLSFNLFEFPQVALTGMAVSYGNTSNYAHGHSLLTDTSTWTWQFYTQQPTTTYNAGAGYFSSVYWQIRSTQLWLRSPSDWVPPPNGTNAISFTTPRRITFTRSNAVIKVYIDGVYYSSLTNVSTLNADLYLTRQPDITGLTSPSSDCRIWGMTMWKTVRSDADILSNKLTNAEHHWLLNGNLTDSVSNTINLTQEGTASYALI
jgi:hypothetical protein